MPQMISFVYGYHINIKDNSSQIVLIKYKAVVLIAMYILSPNSNEHYHFCSKPYYHPSSAQL